jgi:hypothetical protein
MNAMERMKRKLQSRYEAKKSVVPIGQDSLELLLEGTEWEINKDFLVQLGASEIERLVLRMNFYTPTMYGAFFNEDMDVRELLEAVKVLASMYAGLTYRLVDYSDEKFDAFMAFVVASVQGWSLGQKKGKA